MRRAWFVGSLVALALLGCDREARPAQTPSVPSQPGMTTQPGAPAELPPYQGGYRLPVEGPWKVHRTHYGNKRDQSAAVDLVYVGSNPPKGSANEAYPSYGKPIVADGPGVVAIAVDGNPDNPPKTKNTYDMHGNFVVIDHRNGEFSLFAHLIPGTVAVKAGQVVQMGQQLGLCGNSGHSTHPHLHWQIMDNWLAHRAKGVPVRHIPYNHNGRIDSGRMEKGDTVEFVP